MSENNEFRLESGAVLLVTMAPFEDCKALHDAVIQAYLRTGAAEVDPNKLDMGLFLLNACADKEVERCLFRCAERVVYSPDGSEAARARVDKTLFDSPTVGEKARKDYYSIAFKIAEVNLAPFTQALFSVLNALSGKKVSSPEPK